MKRRKTLPVPTRESLAAAALRYLSRYAASEASLRRVLANRLRRAAQMNADFAQDDGLMAALRQEIERIVESHKKSGAIDDAAFVEMKMRGMRRAGRSRKFIGQALAVKAGVAQEAIEEGFRHEESETGEDGDAAELNAALAFARRRRLGHFRSDGADDPDQRRKDLAALARVGFSLDVARRALRGPNE